MRNAFQLRFIPWLTVATLCLAASTALADIDVRLSRSQTQVGVPVQLLVEIEGSTNVAVPQSIDVPGLQIQRTGQSTRVEVINFRMRTSTIYGYTIYPAQEGEFEIPSFDVNVDGKRQRTRPLTLRVEAGRPGAPIPRAQPVQPRTQPMPPPAAAPVPDAEEIPESQIAWAEMIVPRAEAFVGEVIPVEIRFYFNTRFRFQLSGHPPQLMGEGFTIQPIPEPQRSEQRVGDGLYHVLTFRTAVTPLKSGLLEIPSMQLRAIVDAPSSSLGNLDDIFNQFFQGGGFSGFGQRREMNVASDPVELLVKSLPREGRPENFSGAVGEFTMQSSVDPMRADAGEPLTLTVQINGRGNFDAMRDPTLVDSEGWRTYPPTQDFERHDEIGYGGLKQFRYTLVAEENRTATPGVEFSYFNPGTEEYVTLTAPPATVDATGAGRAAAAAATEPPADEETAVAEATPQPKVGETVFRSFSPWIHSTTAWIINGAIAVIVLALVIAGLLRRRSMTASGERARAAKERKALIQKVEAARDDLKLGEAMVAVLEFDARQTGETGAWGRLHALESEGVAPEHLDPLRETLAAMDELRFSGSTAVSVDITSKRADIVRALRKITP